MLDDGKEITTPSKIGLTSKKVYENLFQKKRKVYLWYRNEDNLLVALKNIPTNKTPGNDLSREFYETLWVDIKDVFINSLKQAKIEGSLSISQKQPVIKLLEKKTD